MKKAIVLGIVVLLAISSIFAGEGSLFSFEVMPEEPLYKESISDPYAFLSSVHLMLIPKAEDNEFKINALVQDVVTSEVFYDDFYYREPRTASQNLYINMKLSGSASLFRVRFNGVNWVPSVDLDLNLAGYLNTVFWLYGANDTLDFDGSFMVAGSLRVADIVTIRAGIHHFSGHYGDETLSDFYSYNKIDFNKNGLIGNYTGSKAVEGHSYRFLSATEYVRDNSWLIGIQGDLPYGFRIYGECEIPQKNAWIRPFIHVPADYINPATGKAEDESSIHRSGPREGATEEILDKEEAQKRGSNYMALRIHGGLEYKLKFSWANVIVSADIQAHQDGQNRNSEGRHDILAYNSDNKWEFEYTVGAALELKQKIGGNVVRLEAFYHVGRMPSTQWFYKTGSFIYFGFGLN